jgi:hypothetical protein
MPKEHSKITYGELENFLLSLGFEEIERPDHTVFRNKRFDSLITLPRYHKSKFVEPRHISMVKVNLTGKDVPGRDQLGCFQ